MPEVTRSFKRIERRKVKAGYRDFRLDLIFRDGNQCLCCGARNVRLTIDHIKPVSVGGITQLDNLQLLCPTCNAAKADQTIDYRPKQNRK